MDEYDGRPRGWDDEPEAKPEPWPGEPDKAEYHLHPGSRKHCYCLEEDAPPLGVWIGPDVPEEKLGDLLVEALTGESPLPRPSPDEMADMVATEVASLEPHQISAALRAWADWYSEDHPEDLTEWKPSSSSSEASS